MEAAVSAAYVLQMFQMPCVAIAMMAQVFVGRWYGAGNFTKIGRGLWQFIWFSLLSHALVYPCGRLYGYYYFQGMSIEEVVWPYYHFLLGINFLFPLAAALSCFYLGQGKTRLVLWTTLGTQGIKILFSYGLIFGVGESVPVFGIMGGAIGTFVSQGLLCLILLAVFLNRRHREIYASFRASFEGKLFWECLKPGLLRAGSRLLGFMSWTATAYLVTSKGGDFLLVFSVGGTLFLFLPFISEALCQAQITVFSQILGNRDFSGLDRAYRSGRILALATGTLFILPLILFPATTFQFLFSKFTMDERQIALTFAGVGACFFFFNLAALYLSSMLAFKDMKFLFLAGAVLWVSGFIFMYVAIEKLFMPPEYFWLTVSSIHATTALFYYWRTKWLLKSTSLLFGKI